jgi:pyruvate/2-oxoglutarate dehydrogenase complex dihydrolipoamide dehydrogenase (E3) component
VLAGAARVRARRFVIATGSRPSVPPIPGLAGVPYLTNETIFESRTLPGHLLIIGGGPIGCELAQAHRRLGAEVTVVDIGPVLPKDDPEVSRTVRERLLAEGVAIHDRVKVEAVAAAGNGVALVIEDGGQARTIEGSHLLVAAGRTPRVDGLGLDMAGVAYGKGGIEVDRRLRTSNKRIYAIGDVVGGPQFTHVGSYHAGIVIRNVLFRLPAKVDYRALPWVTYTDPELAHVGRTEASARENGSSVDVLRWAFEDNDRARTERRTEGFVKVVTGRRGRILGASIVGAHAGELILPWVLAIRQKLKIGAMAELIAPYPTLGEVSKRAAGSYYAPKLFGPTTRWLVRQLARLG